MADAFEEAKPTRPAVYDRLVLRPVSDATLPPAARKAMASWARAWGVPHLVARTQFEFSHRLGRSLARCYPDRHLIRLSHTLRASTDGLLLEVLCHELAHLAVRQIHGPGLRPHGPEWAELVRAAGFEPRARLETAGPALTTPRPAGRQWLYIPRCPVCQEERTARRPVRRWRCSACVEAGLGGELVITRRAIEGSRHP
jgi:SprT protein